MLQEFASQQSKFFNLLSSCSPHQLPSAPFEIKRNERMLALFTYVRIKGFSVYLSYCVAFCLVVS